MGSDAGQKVLQHRWRKTGETLLQQRYPLGLALGSLSSHIELARSSMDAHQRHEIGEEKETNAVGCSAKVT